MSNEIIVALITLIGTLLGALINGYANVLVSRFHTDKTNPSKYEILVPEGAKILRKPKNRLVWMLIGGGVGLVLGISLAILRSPSGVSATPEMLLINTPVTSSTADAITALVTSTEIITPTPTFADTPTPTFTLTAIFTETNTFTPTPVTLIDKNSLMSLIPSGFFQMQGEQGLVKIYLNSFYIDQNEVTNAQYEECVSANICSKPYEDADAQFVNVEHFGDSRYGNFPVVLVSWNMASNYCKWRSEGTRLPTDIEWEKAARGSIAGQIYPWGNDLPVCVEGALNGANFSRCDSADAFPVRQFAPNDYGLYDMAGNVGEWVNNSIVGTPGGERMIRGGSWLNDATKITVYSYINASPLNGFVETGFRCAKDFP